MKTTLEIPDTIFRRAKSAAREQRISFSDFVMQAIKEKLAANRSIGKRPWVKYMGRLKHLHEETERINSLIEEDSENIDS